MARVHIEIGWSKKLAVCFYQVFGCCLTVYLYGLHSPTSQTHPNTPPPVCLFRSAGTTCSWLAKWGILWIFLVYFKKCLAVCQNNMSPTEIPCHPDWRPLWPPRTLQAVFHGEPHVAKKTMTNGTIKHVANELG